MWFGELIQSILKPIKIVCDFIFNNNVASCLFLRADPVVLNPNSASPWLSLSADLTSVKESAERLTAPDNPERFDPCVFVVGVEGYTAGKHRWDVIVGDNPRWIVGVCKESVTRKKKFTLSTSRGVWSIGLSKGAYTASTPERTELQVQQRPEKIRVKLNMDRGEVSFWDGGTAKHLVTLTHKFDEKMFPIFGPGLHNTPMILAPGKMAVHTSWWASMLHKDRCWVKINVTLYFQITHFLQARILCQSNWDEKESKKVNYNNKKNK